MGDFFGRVLYLTVSLPVLGRILRIARGNVPSYCHYIKICCGCLAPDHRDITSFLFLNRWSRESVSVSPGEGVPSLRARTILRAGGSHILWSTFSHALSQPKTAWRSAKTVNFHESIMCLKRLMERLYVWLFHLTFRNIHTDETC